MSNRNRIALLSVALFALTSCTSTVVRRTGTTAPAPRVSTPKPGETARVQRGDTLYGIAFRNGIDVRDLAAWNGISAPYTIYPGQSLRLYPRAATVSRPASTASRPATTTSRTEAAGTPARTPGATTAAPPKPVVTTPAVVAPVAPPTSNIRWRWPADGTLLNRFVAGEPTKQGIDITGDAGTPVNAAADGVVVYSGSGLVGYGELVIIKHDDAWLSAYGHNRARMVNEGAIVKAGQQIAVMGRTGAPRDMLHFEIRYNGKPVDPLVHLPKR
ncbi:peptidoglycan DD-metalloendopeptidase family protein [Lysobacter solisilvae (ex Woo and Kim 2020)]|uniref:Peptidoglycan DD-metalloendopeptidase family protein n=1 Tax=Agrilutibacter terrestris TaxID=2865112 RepID=A0A7H0FVI4_9GAMM|nr:peptidoglycan DD-metalloendopeptidase family protein [Lysobacter terrestris]QNP40050.1 peptidoglycan DD-metalloendopeptidase family protein [Lysobacter terrestris]